MRIAKFRKEWMFHVALWQENNLILFMLGKTLNMPKSLTIMKKKPMMTNNQGATIKINVKKSNFASYLATSG